MVRSVVSMFALAAPALGYELVVGLSHRDPAALSSLLARVSDPSSPEYLQHRSLRELSSVLGASDADVDAVNGWLVSLGADKSSLRVSALGDTVTGRFDGERFAVPSVRDCPVAADFVMRREAASEARYQQRSVGGQRVEGGFFGPVVSDIKKAYGIPEDLQAISNDTLQMVWGPGSFGYHERQLEAFKGKQCPLINTEKVFVDGNHGKAAGDNFGEGNLDTEMITAYGLNVTTLVSNTNTSSATEEGEGFGQAFLDFVTELANREQIPQVLSLSLGSLSPGACDKLCSEMVKKGYSQEQCHAFMQEQRQVCMYISEKQAARIDAGLKVLGVRGVSVFAAAGDGGSHFSFAPFKNNDRKNTTAQEFVDALNEISCQYQLPTYPASSPYVVAVGGEDWSDNAGKLPVACDFAPGGFSWEFAAPAHQKEAVSAYLSKTKDLPPTSSYNASGRAYPDISAIAASGTSESAPLVAGIFSLITDMRLQKGLPPLGYLTPRIWQVAATAPGAAFEDITSGNTSYHCDSGFPATSGWDAASGWGRPVWNGLVKYFADDDSLLEAVIV